MVYNKIISNIGNGYNANTGVFTAPVGGTYVFYIAAVEYEKQDLGLDIVLNNKSKVRLIGNNQAAYQTGTNMVVLSLGKGDEVWVKRSYGKGFHSHGVPLTTFTGFLIKHV